MHKPKVVLVIMDGWGYSQIRKGNAIWQAKTPTFDYLWKNYAHTTLNAFGESVGLPWGAIGSSEIGHASIGTGRLIDQEISKIDKEIDSDDFFKNKITTDFVDSLSSRGKAMHIIGLVSDGGVHSRIEHLFAILELLKKRNFQNGVFIHVITDGRDTSPESALEYLSELDKKISEIGIDAKIASLCGRYFTMDRDSRWDRTKKAYLLMTEGEGKVYPTYRDAVEENYKKNISDEFIEPSLIDLSSQNSASFFSKIFKKKKEHSQFGTIKPGDGVIFFNTRPDRMGQIAEMFLFPKNDIKTKPISGKILTLSTYNEFLPVKVAYPTDIVDDPIAKILSKNGFTQGHFAETEKYAHVTYFFNGGNSVPNKGEYWHLVPSPKVATYDLKPEMSAKKVTDKVFLELKKKKLDFVLINYANCDMVGHTGIFDKIVKAVETVDIELKRLCEQLADSTIMITADHGNAESKIHPETGEIDKRHTVNPVPFIIVGQKYKIKPKEDEEVVPTGILADITPAILSLFGLKKTPKMNGVNIIDNLDFSHKDSAKK